MPAIVMVTAYGREDALVSAEERGIRLQSVLIKPVTSAGLLRAIGESLGKSGGVEKQTPDRSGRDKLTREGLHGARILLVEDNEINQELAFDLLRQAGMEIVVANHGREALDILSKDSRFDGILMDCQMPVMDGYAATREIRRNPLWANIPVIAMTANAMAGDKEKVAEVGMVDHIAKPLVVSKMFETLAKWIRPAKRPSRVVIQPVESALPDALPDMPGIDVKTGLEIVGDKNLYRRLLIKFRENNKRFADQFASAKIDVDSNAATRCAHTLKGVAANLGARRVQAAAGELELACRTAQPSTKIDELLEQTLSELDVVITSLANVRVEDRLQDGAESKAHPEEIRQLIATIDSLLEDGDSAAVSAVEKLANAVRGTTMSRSVGTISSALAEYDFAAALKELRKLELPATAKG